MLTAFFHNKLTKLRKQFPTFPRRLTALHYLTVFTRHATPLTCSVVTLAPHLHLPDPQSCFTLSKLIPGPPLNKFRSDPTTRDSGMCSVS